MEYINEVFSGFPEFSYTNPSTNWIIGILNEGLIKTYNPKKTIEYVKSALNGRMWVEKCSDYKIVVVTYEALEKFCVKCFESCGYYQSHKPIKNLSINDIDSVRLYFSSKYTCNKSLEGINVLYHFAPKYVEEKILKNGFVPKSKNNYFDYPERTHFFYGDISYEELRKIGAMLCKANMNDMNNGEYVLFALDCHKIHDDIRFQIDQDWPSIGLFTYDNISPDTIFCRQYFSFSEPGIGLTGLRREK